MNENPEKTKNTNSKNENLDSKFEKLGFGEPQSQGDEKNEKTETCGTNPKKNESSSEKCEKSKNCEKCESNPKKCENSEIFEINSENSELNSETSKFSANSENGENSIKSENFEDLLENLENSEEKVEKEDPNLSEKLLIEKLEQLELTLTDEEKNSRKIQSETLKNAGNLEFKNSNYEKSLELYSEALELCPLSCKNERAILYANRGASKLKLNLDNEALADCNRALELYPEYFKALMRRAKILEKMEKFEESLEDFKKLSLLQPDNVEVKQALFYLPQKINERNEKMKEEMIGKLKDLGNMILRPFGLSTDNFQLNKDPNSGGYSINFQQNKPN